MVNGLLFHSRMACSVSALMLGPTPRASMRRSLVLSSDAARYLGQYGSSKAEQALWARYEAWSQEWAGRDSELRFVFSAKNPHVFDAGLGQNLARSLARGTSNFWICVLEACHRHFLQHQ
jgi:hypothetical protein